MTARSGAFCAPLGAGDTTQAGTEMICQTSTGGRARWASASGPNPRRKLLDRARKAGVKVRRNQPAEEIEHMIEQATQNGVTPTPEPAAQNVHTWTDGPPAPYSDNPWGVPDDGQRPVHVHFDGEVPQAVIQLGQTGHTTYVNGLPLGEHLLREATRARRGQISAQQQLDEVRQLAASAPQDRIKSTLTMLVEDLDAPPYKADVPDGTHPVLKDLIAGLTAVPLARGAGRPGGDTHELDDLRALAAQSTTMPLSILARRVSRAALNRRHESKEGKTEIDYLVRRAVKKLRG